MGCCASEELSTQNERLDQVGKLEKKGTKDAGEMGAPAPKDDPTAGRKKKYSKNKPILLGYWKIRGLAQPIRYLLEYTEHPY